MRIVWAGYVFMTSADYIASQKTKVKVRTWTVVCFYLSYNLRRAKTFGRVFQKRIMNCVSDLLIP